MVETMAQSQAQWMSVKMKEKKGFCPSGSPLAADPARWTGSVRLQLDAVAEDDIAGGSVQGTVGGTPGSTKVHS
jgi:hypothetical protein